jgi:VIT1/CCC1 family predicted Fe2+/Mn2+ transporter
MSGGLLSLLITVAATLSVVLPLLLVEPLELAFQVASGSVILLLFLTGFIWAPFAGVGQWRAGLGMMSIGIVITLCTLVFGG